MSCCDDADTPACRCDAFVHPPAISNRPGLDVIAYRAGDYRAFRRALLLARDGERELTRADGSPAWRPGGHGDLAVQMMEWWAYLADVLTFYNERVATQAYLRTADLPQSVNRLVRLLGYRPRPGLGATGTLAALADTPKAFMLPKGFQVQSKPGPGNEPQTFELDADTMVRPAVAAPGSKTAAAADRGHGALSVHPVPSGPTPLVESAANTLIKTITLKGTSSAVKKGDEVLIAPADRTAFLLATVAAVTATKNPDLGAITRITLTPTLQSVPAISQLNLQLFTGSQSTQAWQYKADNGLVVQSSGDTTTVHLNAIVRGGKPGDPWLFQPAGATSVLATLKASAEAIFYANPGSSTGHTSDPGVPTADDKIPAIAIPHTRVTVTPALTSFSDANDTEASRVALVVRHGWTEVGSLIAVPPATFGGAAELSTGGATAPLSVPVAVDGALIDDLVDQPVLVEDANGDGATARVKSPTVLELTPPVPVLTPPCRVLTNLLTVSRGKTVLNEDLGRGNAAIPGQDFTLRKSPVTYLQNPASASGDDYSSTVDVSVDGLRWAEVQSFVAQPGDAQVFVTREDDLGKTHVAFGDGEFGARLPTGAAVTATYRYGSGAGAPAAGTLTVVLQPRPGLRSIRNPVAAGGGSDPDPPRRLRQLAPRSVLTFGRAVSADDFRVVAAAAPNVTRAASAFTFDALEQRPGITVWVGDDVAAVAAARAALAAEVADPAHLPAIKLAKRINLRLGIAIVHDPRRDPEPVTAAVRAALLDPDDGLFGLNVIGIGQVIYESQVFAACLAVPGVRAVRKLLVQSSASTAKKQVQAKAGCGAGRHDPGQGAYFFLADDPPHFKILAIPEAP